MDYILEVDDLNKKLGYGDRNSFELEDVSFKLKPGYIMGFIGPNGSGKTTTIKLIMNLLKKDSGSIKIFGKDNVDFEKEVKDRIGFVYDQSNFYEELDMDEMTSIIAPFYNKWDEEVYQSYMKRFKLDGRQTIKSLSKGMKTKYALAIALSHHADLIVMDEPTSGLDPVFRREILEILQEVILDENKSIFFSTHITTDLDKIADYITYIDQGKIRLSQSKESLTDQYRLVKGGKEDLEKIGRENIIGIKESGFGFEGLIESELVKDYQNLDLVLDPPILEDIMYYMREVD